MYKNFYKEHTENNTISLPKNGGIVFGGEGQLFNGVPHQGLQLSQKELDTHEEFSILVKKT